MQLMTNFRSLFQRKHTHRDSRDNLETAGLMISEAYEGGGDGVSASVMRSSSPRVSSPAAEASGSHSPLPLRRNNSNSSHHSDGSGYEGSGI